MRLAIVSTYAPKACGIAVFSGDLRTAMLAANRGSRVDIVAMLDEGADYPQRAGAAAPPSRGTSRPATARPPRCWRTPTSTWWSSSTNSGCSAGRPGDAVLEFAQALRQPLVVTLHTVLSEPSPEQLSVLRSLCGLATVTTVFTQTARRMIVAQDIASAERVRVDPARGAGPAAVQRPPVAITPVGPCCRPSGSSQPARASRPPSPPCPRSSPGILRCCTWSSARPIPMSSGTTERAIGRVSSRLVAELGLGDHVRFVDRFADIAEIARLLAGTDDLPDAVPVPGADRLRAP